MKDIKKIIFLTCLLYIIPLHPFCWGQVVIFDKITGFSAVTSHENGTFEMNNDILQVIPSSEKRGGIRFGGNWDLQLYDKIQISIVNYSSDKQIRIALRLENPDMDIKNKKNFFVDYLMLAPAEQKIFTLDIPRKRFYPEVEDALFGMHINPYGTTGDRWSTPPLKDLNPEIVTGISVFVEPPSEAKWGIKEIKVINTGHYDIPVWMTLPKEKFFPFVDIYGQFKFKEWPGKVHSDEDLQKNLKEETDKLAANPGSDNWNQYGGWKNGPKQEAKGHFYVKKIDDKWWMVDPEGCLYWSHGVVRVTPSCGITPLDNRKFYYENLPDANDPQYGQFHKLHDELLYPYYVKRNISETYNFSAANIMRKYGADWKRKYADITHKRLKSWGLNTIANSSDRYIYSMSKTPYCDRIETKSPSIEGASGTGWWWDFPDPFHPEFKANISKQLLERKKEIDDPWCLGLFVDNELGWGNEYSLAIWTLKSPSSQPVKKELVKWLRKKYATIENLNSKWSGNYKSWNDLAERKDEPGTGANEDCKEFSIVVIDAYFKNIKEVFKKVAPKKLYMGCRFAGTGSERALRCAANHCDVISSNIYGKSLDGLKLPDGVDKPVMIGEFHFGALDRGLFHPTLVQTPDQKARGEAYQVYVESALKHPNVIGTHWHQFSDQMVTGRFDGECFQVGFTDICDTPYPETIEKIKETGYKMYSIRSSK